MLAFGLSILLFAFWGMVGFALVALLHTQRNLLQNALLAPVAGVAATVIPIFLLNRAGLPVARFGVTLAGALLLLSVLLIWQLRPLVPLRQYVPFAGVFMLALLMTGWPMLEFGFDWVSYGNDDMANYVLAAHRFLNHGFMDIPNLEDLLLGRDYSLSYWFMHAVRGVRPGSELLLAWVISVTGLTGHQIFMPVILALHLVLISAAGALVHQSRRFRLSALATCLLLSLSALTSLGALYQLIAQVGGLGLLGGCATVLLRPFSGVRVKSALQHGILGAILLSSLLIVYPEVFPFLGSSFGVYALVGILRKRLTLAPLLLVLGAIAVGALALLRSFSTTIFVFLLAQVQHGLKSPSFALEAPLFPYYLMPSGLANLWGLQKLTSLLPEPMLSTSILLGGLLLLVGAVASTVLTWRGQPAATLFAVMVASCIPLFIQRAGFGLYKLAMFIQPFMLATLVVGWLGVVRRPTWRLSPLICLALAGLYAQTGYVVQSLGVPSGGGAAFIEIPDGSRSRILFEFRQLVGSSKARHIVLDTPNIVLAKFQALYTKGQAAAFVSRDFFFEKIRSAPNLDRRSHHASTVTSGKFIGQRLNERFFRAGFALFDDAKPAAVNEFVIATIGHQTAGNNDCGLFIATTGRQSIFNRWRWQADDKRNFFSRPCSEVHDHLIFIHSGLGNHYYLGDPRFIAIYQLERDYFFAGRSMSGVGRHLLLQVVHPSQPVRFVLDLTATLKGDSENRLPPAVALGANRQPFPIVGRGSARVFSPPLTPQIIRGRAYVAIDMGIEGQRFPERRTGLMRLYGTDLPPDRRWLVGFARDISLVSEEDYGRLAPPSYLDAFPADLTNADLEYSGLYEDGWVSETAFFQLTQPNAPAAVAVRGMVPMIADPSFRTELTVLIDGQEIARRMLAPGEFDIRAAAPQGARRRRIDLRFSNIQRLPGTDRRPTAARLRFVGFEAVSDSSAWRPDLP